MSNFLIFKAAFNNSATPAIGTYTAEGATAQFNINASLSPDYYLYNTTGGTAVQWFVPTAETADFEFVADILTRSWTNRVTYFIIADSTGATRLRMWSVDDNWYFENSDSTGTSGNPEYIGVINPTTSGGFGVFHQFRVRVRKLTDSTSSVEVYVDGTLKLTATAGAALVTCAKIGFVGGVNTFGPGTDAGVKNAYVYDLSGGDVIDRGVLSGAFNRFISWMKSKFALKSDIPTVNNGTLTIQQNGTNVQTFTANQSTAATANITVPTAVSELTNDSGYLTSSSNLDASKLTSGTVDIARLPQGALERLVKVANEAARYALTTADVQLGDTVQQLDTGIMYVVTDTDHLDSAAGYTEYTAGTAASVPWSGVTGKPTFAAVATSGAYSDLTGTPALATVATSGAYSDLTGTPTIPTVNDATLTIQQNGVNVQTFTANQSTAATANIQCVDLSTAQTIGGIKTFSNEVTMFGRDVNLMSRLHYGKNSNPSANTWQYLYFRGNTAAEGYTNAWYSGYIEQYIDNTGFARGRWLIRDTSENAVTLELWVNGNDKQIRPIPDSTVDLGSSTAQWNNAYIKSLTINGVACGDILTHNAAEFVDVTTAQTIVGQKIFINSTGIGRDVYHFASVPYGKNTPPANTSFQYIWFGGNTASQGFANSWYGGYLEQRIYADGSAQGRWFIRDTSESTLGIELFVNGSDKQFRPQGNNSTDLGTSTNKWKTINGINPGALSLPDVSSGYIQVDTTNFVWGVEWSYTPAFDGWMSVWVPASLATKRRYAASQEYLRFWYPNQSGEIFRFSFPVIKGVPVKFAFTSDITESTAPTIYLLKAQGNV